jgi:hypothetical protein
MRADAVDVSEDELFGKIEAVKASIREMQAFHAEWMREAREELARLHRCELRRTVEVPTEMMRRIVWPNG